MKKIAVIVLLIAFVLCGTGAAKTQDAQKAPAAPEDVEAGPVFDLPTYGNYGLLYGSDGENEYTPEEMNISSSISLNEDGTGLMTMSGQEAEISEWEEEDGVLTVCFGNGVSQDFMLENGLLTLDMGENTSLCYAHEGTGLVDPASGEAPASMLNDVLKAIDANAGAHLSYEYHSDYMDSTSVFDVHAKDGAYYAGRITKAGGYEMLTATCFLDGTAYTLYPEEMRGTAAISTSSTIIAKNVLLLDDLYGELYRRTQQADFTVETREVEGTDFTAEVYPASDYIPEAAFYFDDAGQLAYVLVGPPKLMPDLGETFYTVHSIDESVDEALFDISAYTIAEQ